MIREIIEKLKKLISEDKDDLLEKEFDYKLLDVALKNYDNQYSRFKDIDNKAIGIITIIGILITFLKIRPIDNGHIPTTLLMIPMVLFLIAVLLCIWTIKTRKYEAVSTTNIINEISIEYNKENIKRIINTVAVAEKTVCEVSNYKAKLLRYAICILGLGIILLIPIQFI